MKEYTASKFEKDVVKSLKVSVDSELSKKIASFNNNVVKLLDVFSKNDLMVEFNSIQYRFSKYNSVAYDYGSSYILCKFNFVAFVPGRSKFELRDDCDSHEANKKMYEEFNKKYGKKFKKDLEKLAKKFGLKIVTFAGNAGNGSNIFFELSFENI